jgi:hypothetical protein
MTSPKKAAVGRQIVVAITMSVLSGIFFIGGLTGASRGDVFSWIPLVLALTNLIIAGLLARKVWQSIP